MRIKLADLPAFEKFLKRYHNARLIEMRTSADELWIVGGEAKIKRGEEYE